MLSELFAFLLGGGAFSVALSLRYRKVHRKRLKADEQRYKQCWEEAVALLHGEGQLTDEQLQSLKPADERPGIGRRVARALEASDRQDQLYTMRSADRRDLEIERAKNGLDPLDDLRGMTSQDIALVRRWRIKQGTED